MCGICGIYAPALDDRATIVAAMNIALHHRGPDDSGQYDDDVCSLAMRRLSIIDLVGGHQPQSNEDGRLQIVFNGEIYNYPELREKLSASGRHVLKTHSDTEVIVHLYEEYGTDLLQQLKGMFALCIYDRRDGSLFLARDRFGEKPLSYTIQNGALAFSSELASLVEWRAIERRVNREALDYYLHYGFVPQPLTMFASIYQLPPGHWLRWQSGQLQIEAYDQPDRVEQPMITDHAEAITAVRETLLRAVKRQMISDVPLGAFLSGGIDSSTIVAAMQHQSDRPIKTFTVRFEHAPYDESPIARQVAQHLGTDHHEFVITNAGFDADDLWRIVRHVGQPFSDSSAIPTYFISRQIREHVTVCLSGDGGDELFAGYDYFLWSLKVDRLARTFPVVALHLMESASGLAAKTPLLSRISQLRKIQRATHLAGLSAVERISELGTLFERADLTQLYTEPMDAEGGYRVVPATNGSSRLRQLMNYRLHFSLPEDMLVKVDRMSMAASLEVRAPMLDVDVAAIARRLPDEFLIHNGLTKYIVRQVAKDWLPDAVFTHPKTGFSIPLHMFQNAAYEQMCRDLILDDQVGPLTQLFERPMLVEVVERGLTRRTDAADMSVYRATHQLWAILQLAAWLQYFEVML